MDLRGRLSDAGRSADVALGRGQVGLHWILECHLDCLRSVLRRIHLASVYRPILSS